MLNVRKNLIAKKKNYPRRKIRKCTEYAKMSCKVYVQYSLEYTGLLRSKMLEKVNLLYMDLLFDQNPIKMIWYINVLFDSLNNLSSSITIHLFMSYIHFIINNCIININKNIVKIIL